MQQQTNEKLHRTMKSRHLFMIALGGVIGTGFFLGSGYTINQAGPGGAILSYLVGGFIMYLTMLCLWRVNGSNASFRFFPKVCDEVYWTRNGLYDRLAILAWLGSNSRTRINVNRFNDEKMVSEC